MPQRILSSRSLRLSSLLIFALIAVTCVLWPNLVQAHGPIRTLYGFYSDASHTTKVGERISYCDKHLEQWGQQTQYVTTDSFRCP